MAKKTGDLNGAQRRMLMNMLWSLLSLFINYFMNFLITPYVTNNIGVEAYGFVALANTFVSYVDILAVGLNAFAGRFIAMAYHQDKPEKANCYFSSTILADLILAALLRRVLPVAAGWAALLGKGMAAVAVLLPVLVLVGLGPRQAARFVHKQRNKG